MAILTLTDERPDQRIASLIDATVRDAETNFAPLTFEGEYPQSGIGIQELRCRHLGIAQDFWQMSVTTSFADWVNKTLGTDNYVIVTGLFNLTIDPATTQLSPSANGKDLPIVDVEQLYALEVSRGWFPKPYAISPSNNITIQAVGRVSQTERLGSLGYTVGKRSYLINKTAN